MILSLLLCVGAINGLAFESDVVDYSGYQTLRLSVSSDEHRALVNALWEQNEIQVLSDGGLSEDVDALVSPRSLSYVEESLEDAAVPFEVLQADVSELIEKPNLKAVPGVFDFKDYYAVKYQHAHLDALVKRHPGKAESFSIGTSYEGRDMKVIRISNNIASSSNKPMIWVDGGIHAREWISSHTAMYIVDTLLQEHEQGLSAQVNALMDKYQFVILPMSNPDGYEFSRSSNRYWRKTRRPSGCKYGEYSNGSCKYNIKCYGIDPNRNWDTDFGRQGVSKNPCSDVYPGKVPFSENNTKAMSDFLSKNLSKIALYMSYHAYSELFLKPVGYTRSPPKDAATHNKGAAAAVAAIKKSHGLSYRNIRSVELYPTSGSSQDWMYDQGVVNAYTIELRDTGRYGFLLPAKQIIPVGEENVRGFFALIDAVL